MQFKYLKYDLYRYFYQKDDVNKISLFRKILLILATQGIWATIVYRYRRWATYECRNVILRYLFRFIGYILQKVIEITTGIHIRPEINIGPGFYIGHFGSIFLGGDTRIGKMCNISQECTIGYAGRGDNRGIPMIGDFVYIAPGAKIFGKIKIGNHVAIGANAVVTKDVPDNAIVGGIPAEIINMNSSRDFILYNKEKNKEILDH